MSEPPRRADLPDVPEAVAAPKSARSIQLVWLIPLTAVLVGGWLAVKAIIERGPEITISFKTGEGLEAGKTKIKYKDIQIGLISDVSLAPDHKRVMATAQLDKVAESFLVEDTRFWAVRPQVTATGVSGLGTLLSGPYIAMDPGKSKEKRREFVALDVPPIVTRSEPGQEFILRTTDLGSHSVGEPVFFRQFPVGEVIERELDEDGSGVTIRIFVRAPHHQYVRANTRFWNASGIDVSLDATGFRIQAESFVSILIGGIAFQARPDAQEAPAAAPKQVFTLYRTREAAMKRPDVDIVHLVFVFKESVAGLSVGAPVDFRGIAIGEVVRVGVEFDPKSFNFVQPVEVQFYPGRLWVRAPGMRTALPPPQTLEESAKRVQLFVDRGMRGQLRTGNLLTGQKYLALDFFPDAPKVKTSYSEEPFEIPTVPGTLEGIETKVAGILARLEKVQYAEIGEDVRKAMATLEDVLKNTDRLVQRLDAELVGETRSTLQAARSAIERAERSMLASDAPLQQDAREALRELSRAAEALRALADYLERHPESLIRGKQEAP